MHFREPQSVLAWTYAYSIPVQLLRIFDDVNQSRSGDKTDQSLRTKKLHHVQLQKRFVFETTLLFKALLKWRHTDTRQDSNLLARVASCNSHSRTMRKYWKHFFLKRQKTVFSSVEIIDQAWNTKLGTINFRPSTLR